jgi:hypothetical protein
MSSQPPPHDPHQPPYPPNAYPPQPQQRRRGCRGCFIGCGAVFGVLVLLLVITIGAVVYTTQQSFPKATSFGEAAGCAVLRFAVNNIEAVTNDPSMSDAEKAEVRQGMQELRALYDQNCEPLR